MKANYKTETADAYLLTVTYTLSTHEVICHLRGLPPQPVWLQPWFITTTTIAALIAIGVAIYLLRRRP